MPANAFANLELALASLGENIVSVLVHRSDATGDIPHVLAAMANNPALGVVVYFKNGIGQSKVADVLLDHFNRATNTVAFVNQAVPDPPRGGTTRTVALRRFRLIPLTDSTKMYRRDLSNVAIPRAYSNVKAVLRGGTLSTSDVRGAAWLSPDHPVGDGDFEGHAAAFWRGKGVDLNQPTVVLWGRESGRAQGLHPEYDHSYTGMLEIIDGCRVEGFEYQVVVAGDFRLQKHDGGNSAVRGEIADKAIVIGKYWESEPRYLNRHSQVRLFYVLKKMLKANGAKLVHVGMRSGGLDMLGFSGQRTIYIAKADGDNRMSKVVGKLAETGRALQFQKAEVTQLPKRGVATPGVHKPKKKGGRTPGSRGFLDPEFDALMVKIDAALV